MERFTVGPDDLAAPHAGLALRRLLEFEGRRAYDYYEQARALAALVDPVGRPMLEALVGVYHALLDAIAGRDFDVLAGRVSVPSWRKAAILARAYLGRYLPAGAGGVEASRLR